MYVIFFHKQGDYLKAVRNGSLFTTPFENQAKTFNSKRETSDWARKNGVESFRIRTLDIAGQDA